MVRLQTRMSSFSNSPRIRSAHKTPILHCHFLDQSHGFCGDLWFGRSGSGLVVPVELESLAMPAQERLRLNNEERLLPCTRRSSEQDQDHPIRLCASRSFDVSAENNELLTEEGVLGHEFGLASEKICDRPHHERGSGRFCPVDETAVERLKALFGQPLDESENTRHSVWSTCLKMGG
jgi:hypothetical protein